ncbi:MAG: M48 family metalloprotease [Candidatus Thorarchaeota archaeon]|nr:M48 family metalloprotease [Candidatus Thorarchaeota archaeon]
MIEDITRNKWNAIYAFLIIDIIQILLVSILYLDDTTLIVVGINFSQINPIGSAGLFIGIALMQMVMLYLSAGQMLRGPGLVELHPTFDTEAPWQRRYSRDDIVKWTMDLAKKSEISVKKIFLMASPLPNAYTFSLPFIGSVVVVHSNTLDVLNEEEMQAIIAHELGHIKNRDSIVTIFTRMPSFFIDLIYLYVYVRLILAIADSLLVTGDLYSTAIRAIVLLAFFLLSRILTRVSQNFMKKASRSAEFMADYHAASVLGHEATINGLIRLGQRVEAITVLIDEIRWLESLNPERVGSISNAELMRMITQYPLDGIDEDNARQIAPWVFLSTRLKHMRDIYGVNLSDAQVKDAVEPAIGALQKKRNDAKPISSTTKEIQVVDWRIVDHDGDRHLSSQEIAALLKLLRTQPNKMLFDREVGVNLMTLSHPDFRRRVLFIADEFGL